MTGPSENRMVPDARAENRMVARDAYTENTMVPDALAALRLALRAAGGEFDVSVREWLREGLARWLNASEATALEAALGLAAARGEPTVRRVLARARRDAWLCEAWRLVSDGAALGPWQRSVLLTRELRTFETRGPWRRLRDAAEPPAELDPLRAAIFRALKAGAPLPSSVEHLHRIAALGRRSEVGPPDVQ